MLLQLMISPMLLLLNKHNKKQMPCKTMRLHWNLLRLVQITLRIIIQLILLIEQLILLLYRVTQPCLFLLLALTTPMQTSSYKKTPFKTILDLRNKPGNRPKNLLRKLYLINSMPMQLPQLLIPLLLLLISLP